MRDPGRLTLGDLDAADRELLAQHRAFFDRSKTGPMKLVRSIGEYLRREQKGGRVAEGIAGEPVASTTQLKAATGSCAANSVWTPAFCEIRSFSAWRPN